MPTLEERLTFRLLTEPPAAKALQKFQEDAGWSISRKDREKQLDQRQRIQWVSVDLEQAKVAIARLELAPPEFCFIGDLVVKSKFRGQGVGRWLVSHIERLCAQHGIRRLTLIPEQRNRPFYEGLGFASDPRVPGVWKKDVQVLQRRIR